MKKTALLLSGVMAMACIFTGCASKSSDKASDKEDGIIGKWTANEDTLKNESEADGYVYSESTIEFGADNKVHFISEGDCSDVMTIKDNDTFVVNGTEATYTYDGTTLIVNGDLEFIRTGDPDEKSVYGEYILPQSQDGAENKIVYNFASANKTTFSFITDATYEYDEKERTLKISFDDEGDEPTKVIIDGDTLMLTDENGSKVYNRTK